VSAGADSFASVHVRSPNPTPRNAPNANESVRRTRHPDQTHSAGPCIRVPARTRSLLESAEVASSGKFGRIVKTTPSLPPI